MGFPPGPQHPRWKGGLTRNAHGYLAFSAGPNRKKYAHRVYMERILGRALGPDEEVHHVCGNRACWPPTDFHLCLMPAAIHDAISAGHASKQRWRKPRKSVVESAAKEDTI